MNEGIEDKIDIHLRILKSKQSLESYCTNCGECCKAGVNFIKDGEEHRILVKSLSCKNLVWKDGKSSCKVYAERLQKADWCADLRQMMVEGLAPKSCPYVEDLDGYKPTLVLEDNIYKNMVPILRLAIKRGSAEPFDEEEFEQFTKAQ